jgi:hypothetical protein
MLDSIRSRAIERIGRLRAGLDLGLPEWSRYQLTTGLLEGDVSSQIVLRGHFSALLILLEMSLSRADKAEISGSNPLRPALENPISEVE